MKRFFLAILCAFTLVSAMLFTAGAADLEPEIGDGYVSYNYSLISCGTVNNYTTATVEKNIAFDGRTVVKVTPTPNDVPSNVSLFTLDSYNFASQSVKVDVSKYQFVGVTYYYACENPSFTDKMFLKFCNPVEKEATSTQNIVTNKWTEAYFNLSGIATSGNLVQLHFRPFYNINPTTGLTRDDVIYIEKFTFYEKNPDRNAKTTITFTKETPDAVCDDVVYSIKEGEKLVVPQNHFKYENAEFLGWKYAVDGKTYAPGDEIEVVAQDMKFVSQWKVSSVVEDTLSLVFSDYANGIVTNRDTGFVSVNQEFEGKNAVKVTPNPKYEENRSVIIDGYSYNSAEIDMTQYNYAALEYYYTSSAPISGKQKIEITNLGNILTKNFSVMSNEDIVTDCWAISTFNLDGLSNLINPNVENSMLRQMWVYPFGTAICHEQDHNDVVYVSRLMFFKEKPSFETHESYMNGYADGTFKPSDTMTRAEACTVVARLLENEEKISGNSDFTDVAAGEWYAKYIGYCQSKGLLKSYSGTFAPNQPITRAEFAELVYLTELAKDKGLAVSFTDVSESHAKYASIKAAASAGLINGYDNGNGTFSFKPDNTITRAEVVTVINRARGKSKTSEQLASDIVVLFLDVDYSHWAFADIAEATVPHVEQENKWLYAIKDPLTTLGEKNDVSTIYNVEVGNAKVAELDELENKRIAEIKNTASMNLSKITGKKIYVSSSAGDDKNDGLTEATAVKTPAKANLLASNGDAVLFKRGDLWRVKWMAKSGITYSAYGEGKKPTFYGSPENGAAPEKWTLVYENKETGALIWQYYDLTLTDVGTIVFNDGEGFAVKESPDYNSKFTVRGAPQKNEYDYKVQLDNNFEFFHAATDGLNIINIASARGPLYLRCDNGNPGKIFDSIEFNTRENVISAVSNVTFDNICVKYGGSHGIGAGTVKNLKIQNCEIGWIGGSIQGYYNAGSAGRFGNGIEVYGGCDGYTIENCYVYECYDAGITHQISYSSSGDCNEDNILYKDNVITDCVYNIEYFLSASLAQPNAVRKGDNVVFEGNLLRRAGFGFGSMRPDSNNQRNIRSGSSKNEFTNYVIRNNILDRALKELTETYSDFNSTAPQYENNVYIQGIGNGFFTTGRGKKAIANISATYSMLNVLGDKTGKFYYVDYIPQYTYAYTVDKTAEVTDEDRKSAVPYNDVKAEDGESTEIFDPTLVRTQKDKKLYAATRSAYSVEEKTDNATGIVYAHATVNNESTVLNMDCYGLPKTSIKNGTVYFKVLMRTNQVVKPYAIIYGIKDENDKELPAESGLAVLMTSGKEEWEEVIIKANVRADAKTFIQIHLMFAGNGVKGTDYYEDGALQGNPYFDIAGWAVFENLASAENYDLAAACK